MNYPKQIYMVRPNNFRIAYAINSHMDLNNKVDTEKAMQQWETIRLFYQNLGLDVIIQDDREDLPDMVFCANTIVTEPGTKKFYSKMRHTERGDEVKLTRELFGEGATSELDFEAMGDLIVNYESGQYFGGYGYRTSIDAYDAVEKELDIKVIKLKLEDERFYHLDTCLCILNKTTAVYFPQAFDQEGLAVLKQSFETLIAVSEYEAEKFLACNAFSPNGKNVLVEQGAVELGRALEKEHFKVMYVDTSEFLKAGGSIFCMKNFGWFR
jgi:N-dimethylarginine dimethylaminohydrolase